MNSDDLAIIGRSLTASFDGTLTFPQIVDLLRSAGVERYYADLVRLSKTYYTASGDTASHELPLRDRPPIAERFSEPEVVAALRANQRGEIDYADFLRRIMRAGTAAYLVFLEGRQAIYLGRHGDTYVERFPPRP